MFQTTESSLPLVYWIRLLTSFAIQSNAEQFDPFIVALGYVDASTFVKSQVEPVSVDADQLPMQVNDFFFFSFLFFTL